MKIQKEKGEKKMPKYNLIASYYDMFEVDRTKRYKNSIAIDGEKLGVDLSTLQAIDKFTSSHNRSQIFQILENQLGIQGKNHLAIQYKKNQNAEPEYYRIIENYPEFTPCTKIEAGKQKLEYKAFSKKYTALGVPQNVELFQKEKERLFTLIEEANYEEIKKYLHPQSLLSRLIEEYFFGAHDNIETSRAELKEIIKKEFTRYKTFRGWIVNKEQLNQRYFERRPRRRNLIPAPASPKKIIPRTQAEYEEKFLKDFKEKYKKSWGQAITEEYNYQYEESLTPEEVENMFGLGEEYHPENDFFSTKKSISRGRRR